MTITKIKILKSKVVIYIDNEKLELDKEVYPNFYLYKGKEISKKEYNNIKEYNEVANLLSYALRIRSKSIYSEYKMREKLYDKGGTKKSVDKVISTLKNYDLIDDKAFAFDYVEYCNSLNYGKNKIISKLKDKGIFEDVIDKLSFPSSEEKRKAKALLPKLEKKYDKYNVSQKKQHIYNAYLNLGFSSDLASEMVGSFKNEVNPKEEYKKLEKDYEKALTRLSRKYQKKELRQKVLQALLSKGYKMNDVINIIERKSL